MGFSKRTSGLRTTRKRFSYNIYKQNENGWEENTYFFRTLLKSELDWYHFHGCLASQTSDHVQCPTYSPNHSCIQILYMVYV